VVNKPNQEQQNLDRNENERQDREDREQCRAELEDQVREGLREEEAGKLKAARALALIIEEKLWPKKMQLAEYLLQTFDISLARAMQLINFLKVRNAIKGDRLGLGLVVWLWW
jgi:hypothetical protein